MPIFLHLCKSILKKLNSKYHFFLFIVFLLLGNLANAVTKWNEFYDYSRRYHFGFLLGTNVSTFKYSLSNEWYIQDSVSKVSVKRIPGLTIGAVADLHLGEYFDLRLIPTLVLSQRSLNFSESKPEKLNSSKSVESNLVEVPLLLKFKSERHGNTRLYIIAGFKYGYDLSSDSKAKRNPADPKIFLKPHNYSYEFGVGFDMYSKYFKFSPEIKLSRGINNILQPDDKIYSRVFNSLQSNFIFVTMYFEG